MILILKCLNFKISAFQVWGTGGGGHGYKRTGEESFGDGTILDLDCDGGHTNLHLRWKGMELNTPPPPKTHTHPHPHHINENKTGHIWIRSGDYINVNMLVVILYYNFGKCYPWRKQSKRYMESLNIVSYNCVWLYNDLNKNFHEKTYHAVNSIRPVVVNAIKEKNTVSKVLKRKLNIAEGWI